MNYYKENNIIFLSLEKGDYINQTFQSFAEKNQNLEQNLKLLLKFTLDLLTNFLNLLTKFSNLTYFCKTYFMLISPKTYLLK